VLRTLKVFKKNINKPHKRRKRKVEVSTPDTTKPLWPTITSHWLCSIIPLILWTLDDSAALCGVIRLRIEGGFCFVLNPLATRSSALPILKYSDYNHGFKEGFAVRLCVGERPFDANSCPSRLLVYFLHII
jgi:hypothetical protein